jgi:hypothetical protein
MSNPKVRYHRGQGHLSDGWSRTAPVTYALEEWVDKDTGNTTILGSVEGLQGLTGELEDRRFVLFLATPLALRCSLRPMGVPQTYEVVPIGGFVQL